jgi:hypothetical protein
MLQNDNEKEIHQNIEYSWKREQSLDYLHPFAKSGGNIERPTIDPSLKYEGLCDIATLDMNEGLDNPLGLERVLLVFRDMDEWIECSSLCTATVEAMERCMEDPSNCDEKLAVCSLASMEGDVAEPLKLLARSDIDGDADAFIVDDVSILGFAE